MNNNIQDSKGNDNTIKIVLIMILISILGLGGYYIYNNMNAKGQDNKDERLDISSEQVRTLYSFIPAEPDYKNGHDKDINAGYKGAYQGKKVMVNDINSEILVALGVYHSKRTANMDEVNFSVTDVNSKVKEMYGFTLNYTPKENFGIQYNAISSIYYNKTDNVYSYSAEGSEPYLGELNRFSVLKTAKVNDDVITLYDNHFYVHAVCDPWHEDDVCYYMYSDANKTKSVKTFSSSPDLELGNYDGNAVEYKHTFKKNSSGNYYWYSSEPVNE